MIYTTKQLYKKYENYAAPHIKIETEVKNKRLFKVSRGLYEDNITTPGYLLSNYLKQDVYLSFEYVLYQNNLIPERVVNYTLASTLKNHNSILKTPFGVYFTTDIPVSVYRYGVEYRIENGYYYLIASKEKALCDLLYKKKPVQSLDELNELLFKDLRIDKEEFEKLQFEDILFLCPLYKKKNLYYLSELIRGKNEFYH